MIIEGFEIENWACIKKLTVQDLPRTGVIVMHGPNRTGKSSLVKALRSCLMDYASSSLALKSSYPRGIGDKPMVCVTFSVNGATYRIKKCFGSSKSELSSRTAAGAWKVETTSAAEAHARVCELVGGDDSSKGLRQLLWLTQAEFQLPDAKKFDPNVQAQLRGILGVLQTPLDDKFIARVKQQWNQWYTGQRKAGKPKLKETSELAKRERELQTLTTELANWDLRFRAIEGLLETYEDLAVRRRDLERQLKEAQGALDECRAEREHCQTRLVARSQAEGQHAHAMEELKAARIEQKSRDEAVLRLLQAEQAIEPAQRALELADQVVNNLEGQQQRRQTQLSDERAILRNLKDNRQVVNKRLQALNDADNLGDAKKLLQRVLDIERDQQDLDSWLVDNPIPNAQEMQALRDQRQRIVELEAAQAASAWSLVLNPLSGAVSATLSVDGADPQPVQAVTSTVSVKRSVSLDIANWGRIELQSGTSRVDNVESDLQIAKDELATRLARFGQSAVNADALDQLIGRYAESTLKERARIGLQKEHKELAPKGSAPLHGKVNELVARLENLDSNHDNSMAEDRATLEQLTRSLDERIKAQDNLIAELEPEVGQADRKEAADGLTKAKTQLATLRATAKALDEELDRLRTQEQVAERVAIADHSLADAEKQLQQTVLSEAELTIDERLDTCQTAVAAIVAERHDIDRKCSEIKGRLEGSEGMHAERILRATRADELSRSVHREKLERDAVDLLYALFDECREKQLGSLMGPIHDRVLSWMRVLNLGDYGQVRFGDSFLPDALIRRDGTAEFAIDEESTGTQEQLGILVRLALGSILTTAGQPTVAILDDPLTHCDLGRLNKMRGILRRASEGDAIMTPQAGPLQIIILTCHPEWFRDQSARVIDLADNDVMQRFPVDNHPAMQALTHLP